VYKKQNFVNDAYDYYKRLYILFVCYAEKLTDLDKVF